MYARPDLATALGYLRRTTMGRRSSTPVAVGAVRPIDPQLPAFPWPFGDPAGTVRVGAAKIVGGLHLFPGIDAMHGDAEPPVDGGPGHPELRREVPPRAAGDQHTGDCGGQSPVIDEPHAAVLQAVVLRRGQRLANLRQSVGHHLLIHSVPTLGQQPAGHSSFT